MKKIVSVGALISLVVLGCSMGKAPPSAEERPAAAAHSEHLVVVNGAAQFEAAVASGLVLVDFWATWCPPCKYMNPILAELAASEAGAVKVVKVDIDRNRELADQFKVESIPTLVLFKGGKSVDMKIGAMPKEALLEWLAPHRD